MTGYRQSKGEQFAVSSGCRYATAIAADVLKQGGTCVDAAIAGSAALCVTLPHSVSIGGDLFALIKLNGQSQTIAINATGAAPANASTASYRTRGLDAVPVRGPLSIQTPGLVAGWEVICQRWATWPLARLIEPAIALSRDGFQIGARLARLSAELATTCSAHRGWRDTYLANGQPISEGGLLKQDRLADALALIARDGPQSFYRGPIAQDIVNTLAKAGGLIAKDDLAQVKAEVSPALTTTVGRVSVSTQPPVSQGVVLLRALSLFEKRIRDDRRGLEALAPLAIAALQTAFAERMRVLGDGPNSRQLAEAILEGRTEASNARPTMAHTGSETTTISAVDAKGNAVAMIISIFADFGSGIVTDDTGILLNNRLSGFFLDETHPNGLQPGKRAMHTLHSVIAEGPDGLLLAGGSPGGHAQPQVNLQVLSRVLLRDQVLAEAAAAPRWMLVPEVRPEGSQTSAKPVVQIEPDLSVETRKALEIADCDVHEIKRADIGSAKWVLREQNGALTGVCDTRRDAAVFAQ